MEKRACNGRLEGNWGSKRRRLTGHGIIIGITVFIIPALRKLRQKACCNSKQPGLNNGFQENLECRAYLRGQENKENWGVTITNGADVGGSSGGTKQS